jgi:hypothetical protein
MFVPAIVTRRVVAAFAPVDAAVVASNVDERKLIPLTRPVITAPLPPPRETPLGPLNDADESPQAATMIAARIAGSSRITK